ncbi:MAG: J domain-containing protein [Bacteroidia bacterium]
MRADDLKLLGLPAGCSADAIRKAYRKRAMELHPDTSPDPTAAEQFQALVAAYERLLANDYAPDLHHPIAAAHRSATYRAAKQRAQAQLTPRQLFWRKTGSIVYRIFTPVLFLILLVLTPLWLMLIPVVPWYLERKRNKTNQ